MQKKQNRILAIKNQPHTHCSACSIRNLALFRGVPESQLEWTQHYRENQYTICSGDTLFRQGNINHHVYTIYHGWFSLYQLTHSGKRQIIRFALPGDFIGFQVDSQGKFSHSAQALTDGILCGFSRKKLTNMIEVEPNISESLIVILSRDMSLCQQHFFGMTQKTAIESISFLLLELYHRVQNKAFCQKTIKNSNTIYFPLTQEDIGDATGVTKIHTNRILRQLRDQKIIKCYKKKLTILNEERLSEIAQFDIKLIKNPKVL
jgi:CRP-like cAMP-binding protein